MRADRLPIILIALLVASSAGCHVGPRIDSFVPARSPMGIRTYVDLAQDEIEGELLSAREDGLLLGVAASGAAANAARVVLVRYSLIRRATFSQLGNRPSVTNYKQPNADTTEALRLLSRFPQGVSQELMTALLAAYGQAEVDVLAP